MNTLGSLVNAQPSPLRINANELPSLTFMIKQYGMNWTLVDNMLSNYDTRDVTVVNGSFTLLSFFSIRSQQYTYHGLPDRSLSALYFPNLTSLRIDSLQMDGSINILYMVRNLSNLITLFIDKPYIRVIPDGFPFTLNKLTDLTIKYYIEPVPDGFGEGLNSKVYLTHLNSLVPSSQPIFRLPDSLCGAYGLYYFWRQNTTPLLKYAADCFKCFDSRLSPYMLGATNLFKGYNYPCDIKVTSLYYKTNDTVIINGNNLQSSLGSTTSGNGIIDFILNNQIVQYRRADLYPIQDQVVLSSRFGSTASIPVSLTRINLGNFITIDQQPFGINISINLNYNINIHHTISINGVACRKFNSIYIKDRLTCFFPLQISSQSTLLNYNIANIRNSEIYQSNFTRQYPSLSNNNNYTITMNESATEYKLELIGQFGMINQTSSSSTRTSTTMSSVLINNTDCIITSINSTHLECIIILDTNTTTVHQQQQQIEGGVSGSDGEFVEIYISIDGHSFTSFDSIYIKYPTISSSSSSLSSSSSSSSSSTNGISNSDYQSNNTKYYIIAGVLGGALVAGVTVLIVMRIKRKQLINSRIKSNNQLELKKYNSNNIKNK
ncbi:hypothetical protein DFA_03084 [Cavenderia fasciculata]|uniref:Uncharacterized protein n=1 Tax=Cavenderia fasciculata TaxID=261658 RepID=F4PGK5_CACFS|nr:uncharacterized protein DFA_03084 [Cavenderia fasciculata]EGG24839.1 hypothetical protein DFA_03084 [Cavenderia fasciculata]|eukprot:XP_004362690.1 hypothetical protein DFA_03084 [Cavenderia fasciculata]